MLSICAEVLNVDSPPYVIIGNNLLGHVDRAVSSCNAADNAISKSFFLLADVSINFAHSITCIR